MRFEWFYKINGLVEGEVVKKYEKQLPLIVLKSYPLFLIVMLFIIIAYSFTDVFVRKEPLILYSRLPAIITSLIILAIYFSPLKRYGNLVVALNSIYTFSLLYMGIYILFFFHDTPLYKSAISACIMLTMASYFFAKGVRNIIWIYGLAFLLGTLTFIVFKSFDHEHIHEYLMPLASFICIVIVSLHSEKARFKGFYFAEKLEMEKEKTDRFYQQTLKQNEELSILNENLIKIRYNLEEANETKNRMFSIIAHDLRGAFNILLGYSEILISKKEHLNEFELTGLFSDLRDVSKRTFYFLENLLEWAMSQSGKLKVTPELVSAQDLINEVVSVLEPIALKKSIPIKVETENKTVVYADPNILKTILRNVVSNAIKFSYKNKNISIKCFMENNHMFIDVEDSGMGMSEKKLGDLFRKTVNNSTRGTDNEKGSGLGLVLVKDLMERSNGAIEINSIEEQGTRVRLRLPSTI